MSSSNNKNNATPISLYEPFDSDEGREEFISSIIDSAPTTGAEGNVKEYIGIIIQWLFKHIVEGKDIKSIQNNIAALRGSMDNANKILSIINNQHDSVDANVKYFQIKQKLEFRDVHERTTNNRSFVDILQRNIA
eukprot:229123_1